MHEDRLYPASAHRGWAAIVQIWLLMLTHDVVLGPVLRISDLLYCSHLGSPGLDAADCVRDLPPGHGRLPSKPVDAVEQMVHHQPRRSARLKVDFCGAMPGAWTSRLNVRVWVRAQHDQ